jgi:hypothetical protein
VIDRNPRTAIMLDEVENVDWSANSKMRAIIDAAYESDGSVDRVDGEGDPYKFQVFCPLAWALRGAATDMPLAVLSRSFVILMTKGTPRIRLPKRLFEDPILIGVRNLAQAWADQVQLGLEPELPLELCRDPRLADKCRPLVAIADALDRGAEARAALIELSIDLHGSDVGVLALEDARRVFVAKDPLLFTFGFDRIAKKQLVIGLVETNPFWTHWRGARDRGAPHKLTTGELTALLRRFGIVGKTIWPAPRRPGDKSARGWLISQFERAWREYCSEGATPSQSARIIELPRRESATKKDSA